MDIAFGPSVDRNIPRKRQTSYVFRRSMPIPLTTDDHTLTFVLCRYMVYTQFQPEDARRMFPCLDDPPFKAVFQLTLVYPKGYTALSNTREQEAMEVE